MNCPADVEVAIQFMEHSEKSWFNQIMMQIINSYIKKERQSSLFFCCKIQRKIKPRIDRGWMLFLKIVEVISVKKFRKSNACTLAKCFDCWHLWTLCSAVDEVINRRGRFATTKSGLANVYVLLFADFFNSLYDCMIQIHKSPSWNSKIFIYIIIRHFSKSSRDMLLFLFYIN